MFDLDVREGIAALTLSRAPVNAISNEWITGFHRQLDALQARDDWSVLLLRSGLKVFCAGADLGQIRSHFAAPDGGDRMVADIERFHELFNRIEGLGQVTLAEIGGPAMGGGLEMALSCDLRICSSDATLGLPEARLGLLPGAGGTQRLTWLCGRGVANRLILGGEIVNGDTARELGIVQWSVPAAELPAQARRTALAIAALSPAALAASKACIAASADTGRDGFREELEATRRMFAEPDTRRRVAAFLDRR